jgi:hypothetical protein
MRKKITFPTIVNSYGHGWCVALPYDQTKFKTGDEVYASIKERRTKRRG